VEKVIDAILDVIADLRDRLVAEDDKLRARIEALEVASRDRDSQTLKDTARAVAELHFSE
jgi:hypothetical protein